MRALTAGSRRISAVPSGWRLTKQVSGTPQARWRESTQSGRASIIEKRRLRPDSGDQLDELVDGGERALADGGAVGVHAVVERLVDGDEPLRGVAEDDRGLGAPGVRVAVGHPAAGEERAGLDQLVDDGLVGLALLALGVEDLEAGEERDVRGEGGVLRARCGSSGRRGRSSRRARSRRRRGEGAMWTKPVPASSVTKSPAKHRDFVVPMLVELRPNGMAAELAPSELRRRHVRRRRVHTAFEPRLAISTPRPASRRGIASRRLAPRLSCGRPVDLVEAVARSSG